MDKEYYLSIKLESTDTIQPTIWSERFYFRGDNVDKAIEALVKLVNFCREIPELEDAETREQ